MSYVKIDDMLPAYPSIHQLGHEAFRLYIYAACWSNLHATNGHLPPGAAERLARFDISEQSVLIEPVIAELVDSGFWTVIEGDGYQIAADPSGSGEFWDIVKPRSR